MKREQAERSRFGRLPVKITLDVHLWLFNKHTIHLPLPKFVPLCRRQNTNIFSFCVLESRGTPAFQWRVPLAGGTRAEGGGRCAVCNVVNFDETQSAGWGIRRDIHQGGLLELTDHCGSSLVTWVRNTKRYPYVKGFIIEGLRCVWLFIERRFESFRTEATFSCF